MTASPWSAVLFDLDGTIADTIPLILACYRGMMLEHYGHEGDAEAWRRTVGRPLSMSLREIAGSESEALALRDTYKRIQEGLHDEMVRAFAGIPEIVAREVDRGSRRAIVTSKGAPMTRRTLDACGVADAFPVVITADDVRRPKPDAEPVHRALGHLGVAASRDVVFIGDSVHDIRSGRAAGVTTVAVTWGALERDALEEARPTHLVEAPSDLQALLDGTPRDLSTS